MQKKIDKSAQILNLTITSTRMNEVLGKIKLQRKNLTHLVTVNPEFVIEARSNPRFAKAIENAQMTVADGWGIVWAVRLITGKTIDRISGTRIVEEILKYSNEKEKKVFLLGAREGVAEKAAKNIAKLYPHARVAYFEGAKTVKLEKSEEASMTIAKINTFEPDYLLVAYGSPWQDIWIEENRPYLRVGMAVGVGGALDELAGVVKLCPKWLDQIGLKWLFRLMTEPWRFGRQLRLVQFMFLVKIELLRNLYHKLID